MRNMAPTPTPIVKKSGNDLIEIYESSEKRNDSGRKTPKTSVSNKKTTRRRSVQDPIMKKNIV